MTKEIDWSKAPEGATHYLPGTKDLYPCWCKSGHTMIIGVQDEWVPDEIESVRHLLVPRPMPWTGEGMPPVGIECESLWNSKSRDYLRVKVLAHDGDVAIIRWLDGDRIFELQGRAQEVHEGVPVFRPIRTPEQIAGEEREKAIEEMWSVYWKPEAPTAKQALGLLYDHGYRKQERQK